MTKLYFASPLFNEMELAFNQKVANELRQAMPELDIFLPQEQAEINDKQAYADSKMIARLDTEAVLESDLLVAVLDGQIIDPGVASEIGIAYQAGIPIIGLFSDTRQQGADNPQKIEALKDVAESQFPYVNLYTVGLIKLNGKIVRHSSELVQAIEEILSNQ
ncbi:nucleoside 2-deoxyribosyltransferase [Facklamia miroungae]|uniref:Nucleoside 2-deoxyribosyltransferase n=1 Tax=Facklamia miroungae TaxID=120956 RepID=A0A1G7RIL2_9LACT|nr:nucleoside 2-deoxyribosyltransferase [Facklamia miroungae]NKZ29399.1 nucleoside 2-deoxyribosyltransferase [Facklamia miroungae]SDG10617.1 Nucleoside 2-deoxyribosyltransferase [Facklamia miroungae]